MKSAIKIIAFVLAILGATFLILLATGLKFKSIMMPNVNRLSICKYLEFTHPLIAPEGVILFKSGCIEAVNK